MKNVFRPGGALAIRFVLVHLLLPSRVWTTCNDQLLSLVGGRLNAIAELSLTRDESHTLLPHIDYPHQLPFRRLCRKRLDHAQVSTGD